MRAAGPSRRRFPVPRPRSSRHPFNAYTHRASRARSSADIVQAVLKEAGKFASDVLAPLNRVGDEEAADFDSTIPRFDPSRPSQASKRCVS
ncbi:hypothetical protein CO678_10050 [Bradyrhizobium diazoefficiens]|uniref:Uncharacterized protein n=1 Tax=Bradyrhizobium diazoefficiens SEMIA 5080 TaxID=754504 RepID=A0A837CCP6_9BRAD|nr:hypothetical protein BJA5080_08367 [Bradyrhizobium diazoefficiens SEMIA 5080]PDT61300.1 hypothetical protein CO678_10050 [Bradyrhizobium diazoefficiens]